MLASLFLKGSIIGFSVAMPVGPVGVLCIQHSLRRGVRAGLMAGLGAASADAFFGCMAGFGFSLLSHAWIHYQVWLQMAGALILWCLGIKIFTSQPLQMQNTSLSFSHRRIFLSTFALTLANPLTFFCFTALYAGLGITPADQDLLPGVILTLGVLSGAAVWWIALTFGISFASRKLNLYFFSIFNRIIGLILAGGGCLTGFSALKQYLLL